MLNDGRLRGFKVGGQWRFSRREIEAWLQDQQNRLDATGPAPALEGRTLTSPRSLPLSCVQAIQGVCAEALEIAAVTTDLNGSPLTRVSNSCQFCDLILSAEEGRHRCQVAWKQIDHGQIQPCHAGLSCVSIPILVEGRPLAITSGCQFVPEPPDGSEPSWHHNLPSLAANLDLSEAELGDAAGTVRVVTEGQLDRVSRLMQRMVDTFSEIGEERLSLLSRLQHIAEMSRIQY
jgi:ligand-binding sensor protein